MKTESGLNYGSVPGEVGEALSRHYDKLPAFRSAIVLSIDSTRTASDILSILARYGIKAHIEVEAVILAPEQLYAAARAGVFAGFDQVWLLHRDRPEGEVRPQNFLPSDSESFGRLIRGVEAGMKNAGCVLALADGFGLGYATWDSAFATFIESQFQAGTSNEGA